MIHGYLQSLLSQNFMNVSIRIVPYRQCWKIPLRSKNAIESLYHHPNPRLFFLPLTVPFSLEGTIEGKKDEWAL